ncbi:MAG: YIP1 family protein [Betaproteobacteria bacterium]|nr:YIP1 family protein [Betaproteobacteria bacterium]
MGLVDRVKNILLTPKTEWPVIEAESSSTGDLMGGYVAPLAGIAVLCGFVGHSIVGMSMPFVGTYRIPIIAGISMAVFSFAMAFVGIFILSLIINALAPTFGGEKNPAQAMKVAVYSYTPAWIAGVLGIIPALGLIGVLVSLYGLYLLYLGLPRLMKNPEEKSIGYTAVVVICAIVIGFVISLMAGGIMALTGGGMGMMGAMSGGGSSAVTFDKDSPMGKLEDFGKKMEEAGKKMEAAQKSGDPQKQMQAAMEGLGAALGGGKRFEPVGLEQLKPLVPERFAGLARTSQGAEKGGMPGLAMSKAEARYGDGSGKEVELEVTDTGGAGGLMALAGWANVQGERDSGGRVERTRKEGNRMVHEEYSKDGRDAEFTVVVGERFVVTARGQSVSIDALRAGVGSLDLGKLESMKDVGAQK